MSAAVTGSNERECAEAHCDDARLMQRIKSGSVDAFEEFYDRYCAKAYLVARSVCGNGAYVEDAVQEAFISIWRGRATYLPERGAVAAWLLSVVRYRAIDVIRRNANHVTHRADEEMIHARAAPGDIVRQSEARADAACLRTLLWQLPHAQLEVIVLAYYGELTHTEIATQLGVPVGTVKSRMRLGLQKLRVDADSGALRSSPWACDPQSEPGMSSSRLDVYC